MHLASWDYHADAILRDGRSYYLREWREGDRESVDAFGFGPDSVTESVRRYFVSLWQHDGERGASGKPDPAPETALIAALRIGDAEHVIGAARFYVPDPDTHPECGEIVLAVASEFRGQGVGTLLLEHLGGIGQRQGIQEFRNEAPEDTASMIPALSSLGFRVERRPESGAVLFSFPTEMPGDFLTAQTRRKRVAAAASVRYFLQPRSVAIVGASRKRGTIGAALVANLKRCGYKGSLFPVNPGAAEIEGIPAFPAIDAIPTTPDMALIAVPAAAVEEEIAACGRAGVRSVVVISAGFGEVSAEGKEAERRMKRGARAAGMRMVGPNCMGVINTAPEISLNANFAPVWPPAGKIGLLSQSGALGYALLDLAPDLHIGISTFVSVGNKADVSANDLLAYWAEDPQTEVIMLYLESFDHPGDFARMAPEIARRKPIVALKSGRSAAGTRAASSHSASLASSDVAVDALFEQTGIIRAQSVEQLLDIARLLALQPLPCGRRVGAITNAGGPGILLADACEAHGLLLPEYGSDTREKLRAFLPAQAGLANPIDMIASATPDQYARAVEIAAADPAIDALILIYLPPQLHPPEDMIRALKQAIERVSADKPVLAVFMSARGVPPLICDPPRGRIPTYGFPENAAAALGAAHKYACWRSRPQGRHLTLDARARRDIREVIDKVLASHPGPVWLSPSDIGRILAAAGIEFAAAQEAGLREAPDLADRLGYPLVAKVLAEEVIHKSDVGGVLLGLKSRAEVIEGVARLSERMRSIGVDLKRVLLQREIAGGIEALVGVAVDPLFGPMLVCGLGGVLVEAIKDVTFRLPPLSDLDAEEMIGRLRAVALLDGYRGAPAGDRAALADILLKVAALAACVPELLDLDLNPIKVLEPGKGAIVVDARMRIQVRL